MLIMSSFTHPRVVSILSFVKHNILKAVGDKDVFLINDFQKILTYFSNYILLCSIVFMYNTSYVKSNQIFISKATICNVYLILSHLTRK